MNYLIATIYEPPALDLPLLAVVIDRSGGIIEARTARSRLQAEVVLSKMVGEIKSTTNEEIRDA